MPTETKDLTVKGDSIERVYGNYLASRYVANRRYQRKLVWTLDEKVKFIDSIIQGFPVPILLLAEQRREASSRYEIIDGMQRLNSIMGFIENEYAVNGAYFDLNAMASTKSLLDSGSLAQKTPVMERGICVQIASYVVPMSVFEYTTSSEVDEVFRRINSGGRKLSKQELRMAGSTGHFAQAVRIVASRIRGDASSSDELPLSEMKKISISSKGTKYGIDVEEVFWVKHGILTKEQVRESKDEELIADILAFTLITPTPPSRSEFLDDYFGFGEETARLARYQQVELNAQKVSVDVIASVFQSVFDQIRMVIAHSGKTLGALLFNEQPSRAPRYFQIIFLAFYKMIALRSMEVSDIDGLAKILDGYGQRFDVPEGGRWGADDRRGAVDSAAGLIEKFFQAAQQYDPAKAHWITQLENILVQSFTEQAAYDFKQGFTVLEDGAKFDEGSFEKMMQTLVGIGNIRRGGKGYVIVGVTDNDQTARRVREVYGVQARQFDRFSLVGVEHEATARKMTLDNFFQWLTSKVRSSKVSEEMRDYIARNMKLVRYYDKSIIVFESLGQLEPSTYDGSFYVRYGNTLSEIPSSKYGELFRRYLAGI